MNFQFKARAAVWPAIGFAAVALWLTVFQNAVAQTGGQQGGVIKGVVQTPWLKRAQALVYIEQVPGEFPPSKEAAFVSQKGLVFTPHILPVLKGTTVDFTNDDNVAHNVSSPPGSATVFNLGLYGVGVKKTQTFDRLGEVPLLCSVHPEMLAFVIVLQNPYHSLTDNEGGFEIKNVPPGTYRLKVWHEKLKEASRQVTVVAGQTATVEFKGLEKR